ncbi:MAG: hypothetical protein M9938_03680 [Solirubrobacterales bacterium]|nr:hypothetical protein [Solirubrobacterales bacterium]
MAPNGSPGAITPREASIFAAAADALLAPEPRLPPVHETDLVDGFDDWMGHAPSLNRHTVKLGLYLLEIAPLPIHGKRFRTLDRQRRLAFLSPKSGWRPALLITLVDTLRMVAATAYFADDRVARQLGYDADFRVARGRMLRAEEGRP